MADLNRFLVGQEGGPGRGSFDTALDQIQNGQKKGHWIWYVFPQIKLGETPDSKYYSINTPNEAVTFLAHPVLGERYRKIAAEVWQQISEHGNGVKRMFRSDFKKVRSSLTLFEWAAQNGGDTALAAQCANILEQAATEPGSDGIVRCELTLTFVNGAT